MIRRHVREKIGPIPKGSMLLVEAGGDFHHLEDFEITPEMRVLPIVVDTPSDDFIPVEVWLDNGSPMLSGVHEPSPRINRRKAAREHACELLGTGFVGVLEEYCQWAHNHCLETFKSNLPAMWCTTRKPGEVVKIDWRADRKASNGGFKGICIALGHIFYLTGPMAGEVRLSFTEYGHIANDPEIGSFCCNRWEAHLAALVAHETAHTIHQCGFYREDPNERIAHGPTWQKIYRLLRQEWVNKIPRWQEDIEGE